LKSAGRSSTARTPGAKARTIVITIKRQLVVDIFVTPIGTSQMGMAANKHAPIS
jgi:hypothetical protein